MKIIFDDIGQVIIDEFNGKAAWLFLEDKYEEELILQGSYGLSEKQINGFKKLRIKKPVVNEKLKNRIPKQVQTIDEISMHSGYDFSFMNSIKYVASYTIYCDEKVMGVMCIGYEDEESMLYKSGAFVDGICNQLAMLIKNQLLFNEAKQELSKRVKVEEELRLFFNTAKEIMSIIDINGKFIKFNNEWINLGWNKEGILEKDIFELVHKEDRKALIELLHSKNEVTEITIRLVCKDEQYRWISWKFKYIKERDVFVSTGRDITEDIKVKEKNEILEKTVQIENLRTEFFANISHEFKTPLNIILSTIQLINKNVEVSKIKAIEGVNLVRYMEALNKNSYRLLRLVNNIIDMTKRDAGFYNIEKGNYNIISIVEDITQSAAEYIKSKDIKLILYLKDFLKLIMY